MAEINLEGLALPEAEEAIAEIWSCLEEYDIPSPAVRVGLRADARMNMKFDFDEPVWAELVRVRLGVGFLGGMPGAACAAGAEAPCDEPWPRAGRDGSAFHPQGPSRPAAATARPFRRAKRL